MKHYFHRILSPFWGKIIVTFLIVIMSIGICRAQYAGLKIHYLGANHSLVQVQEPQKYLFVAGGRGCSRGYCQCIGE